MARAWHRLLVALLWLLVVAVVAGDDALVVTLVARSGGLLRVAWTPTPTWLSAYPNATVGGFHVTLNGSLVAQVDPTITEWELGGLRNNTVYAVAVTATVSTDANDTTLLSSNVLVAPTLNVTNPAAPPVPELLQVGGGFLRVRVAMPADTGGVAITGVYLVVRSQTDGSTTSLSHVASEPEFTVVGLDAKTTYRVRAYVANAAELPSGQSASLFVDTLAVQFPGACPAPTVLHVTGGSIRLQLNAPVNDGGARIKGFVVYMAASGSAAFDEVTNTVGTPQPNIVEIQRLPWPSNEPLHPLTRYDVKVVAVNSLDVCVIPATAWNIEGEAVTVFTGAASLPEAPPAPYFLSATGGQVTIQLLMPGNMGGSNLTGFLVRVEGTVYDPFLTSEERSYSIGYLRTNTSYSVQVAVITNVGTTGWSTPILVTTGGPSRPSSPLNVSSTDITPSSALIQWLAPSDSGGMAISGYRLSIFSSLGTTTVSTEGTSSSYWLNSLVAATTYTVKVIAINEMSLESSPTRARGVTFQTLPLTVPSPPFGLSAVSSSGGAIEVAWHSPVETGGDKFMYNVTMVRIAPCFMNNSCVACDVARIPSNDNQYVGGQSCEQPSTTSCPDGSASCCITTSNSSIGSGHLCSRLAGVDRYHLVLGNPTVSSFQQLNFSTTYFFAVQAINRAGKSQISTIVGLRTRSQTPPSYPSAIRHIGGTGGSVVLTWGPPQDTGGAAVIGYHVYRNYQLVTNQPVLPPYTDCGGDIIANTQYLYSIATLNASRREGALGSLLVTTSSVTPPLQISPLTLAVRAVSWLNVTVTPSCDLGGSRAVSYQFIVSQGSDIISSGFFACCNILLSGLEAARDYQVSVRVANEAATREWVNGTFSTSSGIPMKPSMAVQRANSYSLVLYPESDAVQDREILGYELEAYTEGTLIQGYSYPCDSVIAFGLRVCPNTYRLDGLSPNTTYLVRSRALGPNGVSEWTSQSFTTSNESRGMIEFVSDRYSASSGDAFNVTVRRVNGTAGSLSVVVDVSQPDTVVVTCDCFLSEGCSCQLQLRNSGASSKAGTLSFQDGQETQVVRVSTWEYDPNVTRPMSVVFSLTGEFDGLVGAQSQAVVQLNQSQLSGFPSFTQSDVNVLENASFVKVNIVRLNGSSGTITFDVDTFDVSSNASKDYMPLSQTLQMADRQSQTTVWVRLIDNMYYEGSRVFGVRLRLHGTNVSSANPLQSSVKTRRITIIEDEDPTMLLPDIPPPPRAVRVTGGEIELGWEASNASNATTSGFLIRVSTPSNGVDVLSLYNTSSIPTFTLSSLRAESLYRFQVAGWNAYGVSEFSGMTIVLTTRPTPPSAPVNFRSTNASCSSLELAWDPPRDLGGGLLRDYVVLQLGELDSYIFIAQVPQSITSYRVQGLNASTAYAFFIAASTSAFDVTPSSMTANLTALTGDATVPAKPPPPSLISAPTGGTLTLRIGEPAELGGTAITDYSLYMRKFVPPNDAQNAALSNTTNPAEYPFQIVCSGATPWANDSSTRSCTVYKILVNTDYEFYVVLQNVKGFSEASDRVVYRTASTVGLPSAPENFRASQVTAGNILLEWELPMDLGGSSGVIGYTVFQRTNAYFPGAYFVLYDGQDSTERRLAVKGLTRGTMYAFAVIAQNAASYCVNLAAQHMSDFLMVATLEQSVLSAPQSVKLISATGGAITIGWQAPDDLAGIPLGGYIVELISNDTSLKLTPDTLYPWMTTFTHYNLTEQTAFQYVVTGVNQEGLGERSLVAAFSTVSVSTPTGIVEGKLVEATGGRVTIAWNPPLDTGGRPIIYYQITRNDRPDHVRIATSATFTDTSGLVAQTQYVYVIRAFNGYHLGDPGVVQAVTGLPTVPEAPQPTGTSTFGGMIEMTWTSAEDTGGIPILSFRITLFDEFGTTPLDIYTGSATNYTFRSLLANTKYMLELVAVNEVGQGPAGRFELSTSDVDPPSPPPPPTASEVLGGSMVVTVSAPSYNGGENVTLVLQNGSTVLGTFSQDGGSAKVLGLVALTQYRFRVIAKNSHAQTTGEDLVVGTGPISKPSVVTAVTLVESAFDRLSISWPAVNDSGGDLSLQYEIKYFACDATGQALPTSSVAVLITSTTQSVLMSLNHTTNYSIAVRALTSSGIYGESSATMVLATEEPLMGRIIVQFADVSIQEGNPTVSIPLIRVEGSFGETSYTYQVYDETAAADANYNVLGEDGSFASGVKSGSITVAIVDDSLYNPNITFVVEVRDVPSNSLTRTRVTIRDNGDAGFISFSAPQYRVLENVGMVYLPITRNGGSSPVAIIEPYISVANTALATRFTLVEPTIPFDEGDTIHNLAVLVQDDTDFQYWPDSVVITIKIVEGGVWAGDYVSINLTAVDDGDVSPPKEVTGLKLVNATGGSLRLQWTPPVDRGATDVELRYLVQLYLNGDVFVATTTLSTSAVLYGLTAQTTYQALVSAGNGAGFGDASSRLLLTTTKVTPPTAPLDVNLIAASSSTLYLSWSPPIDAGGSPIVGYTLYNVLNNGSVSPFPSVSCTLPTVCSIRRLLAWTIYRVQIRAITTAVSTAGNLSAVAEFQTSNPDVPDPPPLANVTWVSAGAMTIKMFSPINVGGSEVEQYRLFIRGPSDLDFKFLYQGNESSYTVYRLDRRTNYEIKYQVINAAGASDFGSVLVYQTLERSLVSAPLNLSVVSATGGAITLQWTEPLDVGGRAVSGYTITVRPPNVNTSFVGYDGRQILDTSGVIYGLTANTTYTMYAIAYTEVSNCFSPSEWAAGTPIKASTTLPTLPTPAPALLLVRVTGGIVELTWSPPQDEGGVPITGYTLFLVSPTGTVPIFSSGGTGPYSFIHNDLIESTMYTYLVKANSSVGDSPESDRLVVKTLIATAPSAPLNVRQLQYSTGGAIQIGWDRPIDTGGQPLQGYWIYRDGATIAQNLDASSRSYIDTDGLRAVTSYVYTVRAVSWSTMGSELSLPLSAKTGAASTPQRPSLASNSTGASFLSIEWAADPDAGGLSVSLFEAKLMQGSVTVGSYVGKDTAYRFTKLAASTNYTFGLVAYNQLGGSRPLSVLFTTLPATTPAAPPVPVAVLIFGGNITVEITAPIDTGGVNITGFQVYEASMGFLGKMTLPAGMQKTQLTVFGLVKTTDYKFTASAVNPLGEGPPSPVLAVRSGPISAPGPISAAPNATGATGTSLSVAWALPIDTGGDLSLSYEVRFVDPTGAVVTAVSITTSATGTGLKYFTLYTITVRVTNAAGKSAWSPPVLSTTLPDAAGEFNLNTTAVSVLENAGQVVLTVLRTNGLSGIVTIAYSVATSGPNATATVGSDFALEAKSSKSNGFLTFASLQETATITVLVLNDNVYESPDEQFTLTLSSATLNATGVVQKPKIGVNSTAVVTIVDDGDAGYISFAQINYFVSEATATFNVSIIREGGKSGAIVLGFTFTDGTATVDRDYRKPTTATLKMENNQTFANLSVGIINDKMYEFPDETFTITVACLNGGAQVRRNVTTITILDDGDQSVPAIPPQPTVLATTGGSVRLALQLPAHNGSASFTLTSYQIRITNQATGDILPNSTVPVANVANVGRLTARTPYGVSVAASNAVGQSPFSSVLSFSTTDPTLPGPVTNISLNGSTGGSVVLAWLPPNDSGGVPITKYRVYQLFPQRAPQFVSEFLEPVLKTTVYGLTARSAYLFAIQAGNGVLFPEISNGWGMLGPPLQVVTAAASLPGPTIIAPNASGAATGGSVTISWSPPLDTGGTPILAYGVYARSATTGFSNVSLVTDPASVSAVVDGLSASSWYEIFLLAVNEVGNTSVGAVITCATGSSTLTTAPDLSKTMAAGSVLLVGDRVLVIGNVSNATKGTLPLAAVYTGKSFVKLPAVKIGMATRFANLSTAQAMIPRVPPPAVLVSATGGSITFRVEAPGDTGGVPITNFKVKIDGEEPIRDVSRRLEKINNATKAIVMSITNLSPQTSIEITALAINSMSLCNFNKTDWSEPVVFQTTALSPPGPPQVALQYVTGGGMKLSLVDPFDKGGAEITRYLLYMTPDPGNVDWKLVTNVTQAPDDIKRPSSVVAQLKSQTKYYFRMSVNNGVFESPNSTDTAFSTSVVSPPGPCQEPTLVEATGGKLVVAWDDPLDNGGAAVIDFTITIQQSSSMGAAGKRVMRFWQPHNYTFYGLTRNTPYSVFIRARNEKGSGADGPAAEFSTTDGTSPSGNIAVTVVGSTGGAAILSFNEPLDLGGVDRDEIEYHVFVNNEDVLTLTYDDLKSSNALVSSNGGRRLAAGTPVGVVVGGLDPSSLYSIRIQPVNVFATGPISEAAPAKTTVATLPSAPRALDILDTGGGSIQLNWTLPADTGGLPLSDYIVYMGKSPNETFTEVYRDTTTTCRVTALNSSSSYWFYVVATNGLGASPPSSTVNDTTLSLSPPSRPGKITVISVSEDSLACSWIAPLDAGGSNVTNYTITATDVVGGTSMTVLSQTTSATISGLSVATQYSLTVTAANDLTSSSPSIARLVSTAATANAPAGPFLSCVSKSSVSLTWYQYPSGTQYRLLRDSTEVYVGSTTRYVDSELSNSVTYEYKVEVSLSGAWTGVTSPPLTVTTLDQDSDEASCSSEQGFVSETDYKPNEAKSWLLSPAIPFKLLTLEFTTFDLECDHDYVRIEAADDASLLWQGGCTRNDTFVLHSTTAVRILFKTDASVEKSGFELIFETDRYSLDDMKNRVAPPRGSTNGTICTSHGTRQSSGACKCSVGFTGEACSNHMICCSSPARCFHEVCTRDASRVIVVSDEFGDDLLGTGAMMNTSEVGTASKAVKTLSKGLSLARDGDTVFVYPGVYTGPGNRALQLVSRRNVTIQSLKGFAWTMIDCESAGRAITIAQSSAIIDGFTILNGLVTTTEGGGSLLATDSTLALQNVLITASVTSVGNGGALVASMSNLTLSGVRLQNNSGVRGGAVSLVDSYIGLYESNITKCQAEHGGAVALQGVSTILGANGSFISKNVATGDGGGVHLYGGVAIIQTLLLTDNQATRGGAFAAWNNSNITFDTCELAANNASSSGGAVALIGSVEFHGNAMRIANNVAANYGGGVFVHGPLVSINFSSNTTSFNITRNQARFGAGVALFNSQCIISGALIGDGTASVSGGGMSLVDSSAQLKDVVISNNTAFATGGGLHAINASLVNNGGVVVDENRALTDGGGIFIRNSTSQGLLVISRNRARHRGGGAFGEGTISLRNASIHACTANSGAGSFLENATATWERVQVTDCSAIASGGGVVLNDGTMNALGSVVQGCSALVGGGLASYGVSNVSGDLVVSRCTANNTGGALYATNTLTVTGIVVQASNATVGGGIFVEYSTIEAKNVTLQACNASLEGGGWSAHSSSLNLKDVLVAGHVSNRTGGGLAIVSSRVVHSNVNIFGNTANTSGGGIFVVNGTFVAEPAVPLESISTVISNNSALQEGGNVFVGGTTTIASVYIARGTALQRGGGLAAQQAVVTIQGSLIIDNFALQHGGGVSLRDGSRCDIIESIVRNNTAAVSGGGAHVENSVVHHNDVAFIRNIAWRGGAFAFEGTSRISMVPSGKVSFLNGSLASIPPNITGDGSAMYLAPHSDVEVTDLRIHEGKARLGGIFVDAATLRVRESTFVENNATQDGGAIYANANSYVVVANTVFSRNKAAATGGAIRLAGDSTGVASANIADCELTENWAFHSGGALGLSTTVMVLTNTRFEMNSIESDDGGGGAITAITSAEFNATNCTFANNTVRSDKASGAALYLLEATTARVANTTITSDENAGTMPREGGAVYIKGTDSMLAIENCEIASGQSRSGGALYIESASVSMVRTTVRNSTVSEFGGALFIASGGVTLENCTLSDNDAVYDGGAVYVQGATSLTVMTTLIQRNKAQDGGGGLFVAPGGGAVVAVTDSNLAGNVNGGLGSAIFVGRKNKLTLLSSTLENNGGFDTGGGTLYVVDADVVVNATVINGNAAVRGAAIELSRDARLKIVNSSVIENQATTWGGALYMSVRSIATIQDTTIQGNTARTGGALYVLGSSTLTMRNVTVANNRALSFGGAVTLIGRAKADIATSAFVDNAAYTGGALSVTQNASLSLVTTLLTKNSARDFGGAIYVDSLTPTNARAIQLQGLDARDNTALAGADIYWVYHAWFQLACESCESLKKATSPMNVTQGWWPTRVTSGVAIGTSKPKSPTSTTKPSVATNTSSVGSNSGAGSGNPTVPPATQAPTRRRLDSLSSMDAQTLTKTAADPMQSSPYVDMLWPTLIVHDFYNAIASEDNRTECQARRVDSETDHFNFYPVDRVSIARGYVTLVDAQVLATSRTEPFELIINCSLADDVVHTFSIMINVDDCDPGFENADGRCVRCKKNTYSLDGVTCHACPYGAKCEGLDEDNSPVGVDIPARAEGFYLHESRESYLGSFCSDPSSWDDDDPCRRVAGASNMTMTRRLQRCSKNETFSKFWPARRVFACLAELEYYECDTRDACVEENVAVVQSIKSVYALSQMEQCEAGYGSVTCATCQRGFYKVSNGTCNPCSDPTDPNVAKITRLLAMVPLGFAVVAFILVWLYFSNAAESEIMKQARAAHRFQVYDPHAQPRSLIQATSFFIRQRVADMMARARRTLVLRRQRPHVFQIAPPVAHPPPLRAEKFKIMLGFFQIFGGFKKLYEIPWPHEMSQLMDIFSIADFSLVDTTGIECFLHKDYFSNYRLSLLGLLALLFLTALLLSWGVVRYRVKLSGLPRHCVSCGLPVFKMLRRQPKTLVRRSTMVSMLRIQQKEHELRMRRRSLATRAKDTVAGKMEEALARIKNWWNTTRAGRWLDRFFVFTRLPASSSRHYPSCPTAQRIESEVLLMVVRSNLRLWRSRVRLRLNYQSFKNKCIKLLFWILLLFYPELSQRVVGMFYCDEIGSKHYMSRDKSRLCYEGEWLYYLPLTLLLLVVWVFGIPFLFWTIIFFKRRAGVNDKLVLLEAPTHVQLKQRLLREMREDLVDRGIYVDPERMKTFEKDLMADFLYNKRLSEPSMIAQVGFIYHSYRNEFWWFEVWDLGRKLCLNCVIGLLAKTGANRIITGLIVFLVYLSVLLFYQPYKEQSDSTLAGITQIQLFITLFCGLLLKMMGASPTYDNVISMLTYAAFISNVCTMTFAVFSIVYEKVDAARKARRRAREDHRRAIQKHVRKLWLKAYGWVQTEIYLLDDSIRPMPFRVILELARRDREEKKLQEMDLQLARSLHADNQIDEGDENVSASQIQLDLPRPESSGLAPRSSSSSLKKEPADDGPDSDLTTLTQPEATSNDQVPALEDNQDLDVASNDQAPALEGFQVPHTEHQVD